MRHTSYLLFAASFTLALAAWTGLPSTGWALSLSTQLSDNPFFVAHKEAVLAADRADQPWDLSWALPLELRDPQVWRASVASLPPASLRGVRSHPEEGMQFVGWPPVAITQ